MIRPPELGAGTREGPAPMPISASHFPGPELKSFWTLVHREAGEDSAVRRTSPPGARLQSVSQTRTVSLNSGTAQPVPSAKPGTRSSRNDRQRPPSLLIRR